jgi:hypothetical protein
MRYMRKILLLLTAIGFATSLWAADPCVGTWKFSAAKSIFPANEAATKEETMVVQEIKGSLNIIQKGTRMDGSPILAKFSHSINGGTVKGEEQAAPQKGASLFSIVVAPGNRYLAVLFNDEQVELFHIFVSNNGKRTTIASSGVYDNGKPFKRVIVYDKQ